jgi:hypothetical protein
MLPAQTMPLAAVKPGRPTRHDACTLRLMSHANALSAGLSRQQRFEGEKDLASVVPLAVFDLALRVNGSRSTTPRRSPAS